MPELIGIEQCEQLSAKQVQALYREYVSRSHVSLTTTFGFGKQLVEKADGVWLHTRDGGRILDFTGAVGVLNHGHNHPRILQARKRFAERGRMEVHKAFLSPYVAALSHNVGRLLPGDLDISYFPNSGAEANEGAIKLAYKYHEGRRRTILRSDISFHGKLLATGSLTGSLENSFRFPGIPNVSYPYGDVAAIRDLVAEHRTADGSCDVYAIMVEPFSASTMNSWSEAALRELRELCTQEDIVLIFDEIYTGWGKSGTLFYFMRYDGLIPDVLTYSKSFGGGKASISGYTTREPVFRKAYDRLSEVILHSTTYYGFGEETATAIEAVNIIVEEDYPARARKIEEMLAHGLKEIQRRHPGTVRSTAGVGAIHGVFLDGGARLLDLAGKLAPSGLSADPKFRTKLITSAVIAELYREHGILTYFSPNGDNPLVVAPSLVMEPAEVDYFLTSLDATLAKGLPSLLTKFARDRVLARW
ncbi:aspartate aminotransferase family protein [Streptomyces sp. TS71-3]|uniref:aspartate aminotransferase family protein n=1 Tax=Streptomyces sp. TS71-3 TaxID=2733862 RepID=UPI001B12881E|nr:aminotransferase class III-fold pyridoxal phosphate-dependent enzyme [Streptomyces sp. TS71-3]GHJ39688.1 aspartate aminotransferase family protein [Streptomyces sp. TS71-3]